MKPDPERMNQLRDALATVRTAGVAILPTPLQEVPRFSEALHGPRIFIKREDLTGLATGGNKTRKLEYILGDALDQQADVLIGGGGTAQSNHARQCAAAARRLGMDPVLVLRKGPESQRRMQGNLLLDYLLGAEVHLVDESAVRRDTLPRFGLKYLMDEIADEKAKKGRHPYVLPTSSVPLGAVAYVAATLELWGQFEAQGFVPDHIYLTSTGSTQAGLALGSKFIDAPWDVTGIAVAKDAKPFEAVSRLANEAADALALPTRVQPDEVNNHECAGEGYGILSPEAKEAISLLARTEGMLLDPVYSAKGMAGMIQQIRQGRIGPDENVVFVHTGGTTALFAYERELAGGFSYFDEKARPPDL